MKKDNFGSLDTKDEKEIREMEEALKEKYDHRKNFNSCKKRYIVKLTKDNFSEFK